MEKCKLKDRSICPLVPLPLIPLAFDLNYAIVNAFECWHDMIAASDCLVKNSHVCCDSILDSILAFLFAFLHALYKRYLLSVIRSVLS